MLVVIVCLYFGCGLRHVLVLLFVVVVYVVVLLDFAGCLRVCRFFFLVCTWYGLA